MAVLGIRVVIFLALSLAPSVVISQATVPSANDFPHVVKLDVSGGAMHAAAVVSQYYVVTTPEFSSAQAANSIVYSGAEILAARSGTQHKIKRVLNNGKVAVLVVCPKIAFQTPMPLDAEAYDFSANTTANAVHFLPYRGTMEMVYTTSPMLTPNSCDDHNSLNLPGQSPVADFTPEDMTCTPFSTDFTACWHIFDSRANRRITPLLTVGNVPIAVFSSVGGCTSAGDPMTTMIAYARIFPQKGFFAT